MVGYGGRSGLRFFYWADFSGGDLTSQRLVKYDIPGYASGFYWRREGDLPTWLSRFDCGGELGGEGGSILGHDGCWRWSGGPERNVYRGSDDGYPVTAKEARQIIVQLGHAVDVLEEPDVDWPAPERPDEMRRVRGWTVRRAWLAVRARCHSLTGRDMA